MKKPIIGSIERIKIVSNGDGFVSAKIDTGADNSSIWATNIAIDGDYLTYVFFSPSSTYFTGKVHKTKRYKISSVRNSFGHTEVRYKVYLKVLIGEHEVKGWFTLSDRSQNNYPVLLGKSILKNKFLVDVSQNHVHSLEESDSRVLIVSAGSGTQPLIDDLSRALDNSVEFGLSRFEDMLFDINGDLTEITDIKTGKKISEYSLVYVKAHWKYPELAGALAGFLSYKSIKVIDTEITKYTSRSKLTEMMKLSTHSLPVPRSFAGYRDVLVSKSPEIQEALGFPLILKKTTSDRGNDNYYIDSPEAYESVMSKVEPSEVYVAQKYIPNEGFLRVNILGQEVTSAVYRKSYDHPDKLKQHLNKPSGGVNAELVDVKSLSSEVLDIAVRSSVCMSRQVAGADVIKDKETGKWYILEVNSSPQIRTGAFAEQKTIDFANFIKRSLER